MLTNLSLDGKKRLPQGGESLPVYAESARFRLPGEGATKSPAHASEAFRFKLVANGGS